VTTRRPSCASIAFASVIALASTACRTQTELDSPPPEYREPDPPKLEAVRRKNTEGVLVRESFALTQRGHAPIPHGVDRAWYANGAKEWERAYDHGKPTGTWKRWYADGTLASETTFAGPNEERPMRFWNANGTLAAEGPARDGSRCGRWKFWRPDGSPREEGVYVDSLREGEWTLTDPDGSRRVVTYARNALMTR